MDSCNYRPASFGLYYKLALLHLDLIEDEGMQEKWELYQNLESAFRKRHQSISFFKERIIKIDEERAAENLCLQDALVFYNRALSLYEQKRNSTDEQNRSLAHWENLEREVSGTRIVANLMLQKAKRASNEYKNRHALYLVDPVFSALWEGKFDTENYSESFINRFLDNIAAWSIAYVQKRKRLVLFHDLVEYLEKTASQNEETAAAACATLSLFEQNQEKAVGLPALLKAVQEADKQLNEMQKVLDLLDQQYKEERYKLVESRRGESTDSMKLIDEMVVVLSGMDIAALRALAEKTQTHEDDLLLDKLEKKLNYFEK